MALNQSVLSELFDASRTGGGLDLITEAATVVCQEPIEAVWVAPVGAQEETPLEGPDEDLGTQRVDRGG